MADRWQSLRRRLRSVVKLAALTAVAGGAVYWLKFAPLPVSLHQVKRGDLIAEVMGTGVLEAHFKSTISPRISGRIQEVLVDMGDQVTAAQPLVRLDDVDLKPQVEIARAAVVVVQAALDRLQADRGQALALLEQTAADHKRAVDLLPGKAISQEGADKATAAWKVAQAGVARADAALVEAGKQLLAAQTTLAYRQSLLRDAEIVAPFDGLIVQRQRDPGDIAVPGSAVLTLISTKELWITAWVDETEMSRVAVAQPARVVFRSEPDRAYRGEVARLGRQADRETREFSVDVHVLELPKNWAVGQRAEVYIRTDRKSGVTVLPAQCVLWRNEKPGVFVRQGQYAAWRSLTLGLRGGESVEALAGLEPGEWVALPADAKSAAIEGRRISAP